MSLGNVIENEFLQDLIANHPNLYLALSTTDPGEDGSGITEPSGMGYERVAVGDVTITMNELTNDNVLTFAASTGDWGTIEYGAIYDAETGGVFCGSGSIVSTPVPINTIPVDTVLLTIT